MTEAKKFYFQLGALAVLVVFLWVRAWLRNREVLRRRRADWVRACEFRKQWRSTTLDIPAVTSRLQRLRRDYVAAVHSGSHTADYRKGLVATVRRAIASMSFFRRARAGGLRSESVEHGR